MARPTDYRAKFCDKAKKLCENGATDLEVADNLNICAATLYRWKSQHPEFCEALKVGKAVADERVERSLYNRAVGYSFGAVKIFMPAGASEPVYAAYQEHCPPDPTSAIFWLKNRRPEQWRDVKAQEITGANGGAIKLERITRTIVDPGHQDSPRLLTAPDPIEI